ncbi:MAG: hypothetical protein AB7P04_00145 [Bacteriovoracia bacterium]
MKSIFSILFALSILLGTSGFARADDGNPWFPGSHVDRLPEPQVNDSENPLMLLVCLFEVAGALSEACSALAPKPTPMPPDCQYDPATEQCTVCNEGGNFCIDRPLSEDQCRQLCTVAAM